MTLGDIDVGANLAISSSSGAITGGGAVTVTGTSRARNWCWSQHFFNWE